MENGASININLISNDSDDENTFDLNSIVILTTPEYGTLVDYGDGTISYFHNGSETLTDSFTYTISDSDGATSNIVTVNITITGSNVIPIDPPIPPAPEEPEAPPEDPTEEDDDSSMDEEPDEVVENEEPDVTNEPRPIEEGNLTQSPIDNLLIAAPELQQTIFDPVINNIVDFDQTKKVASEKPTNLTTRDTVVKQQESNEEELYSYQQTSFSIDPSLLKELKQISQEITEEAEQQAQQQLVFERTVEVGGVVMFAGFVKWLLQASSLAASLLGALPAWRWIDPIPVLLVADKEEDEKKVKKKGNRSKTITRLLNKFRSNVKNKDVNNR